MEKAFPSHVTGAELARLFSVTRGAITKMVSRRVLRKTAGGKFDVIESFASVMTDREERLVKRYGKGDRALVDTEIRKEHLAALKRKREEDEGKMIADAVEALGPAIIIMRNKMLGLAVRYAPYLVAIKHPAEAQRILEGPIRDALNEMQSSLFEEAYGAKTNGKIPNTPTRAPGAGASPAAKADDHAPT